MCTMLFKTNIFGLVGSDNNPEYKQNNVIIWDDKTKTVLCKYKIKEKVLNLKLRRDRVVVVCHSKIYVLNLKNFDIIDNIETGPNPNGLVGISYIESKYILVYPSKDKDNHLTIKHSDTKKFIYISPHKNKLAYITLSYNGLLLATASEDGKKIRIFETESWEFLQELNRGQEKADIKCISIDFKNQFIAASSERGTIHIWSLAQSIEKIKKSGKIPILEEENNYKISNVGSMFTVLPSFLGGGYFKNEWSFAQVRLDESYSIFHFGVENSLIIITSTGKYYKTKIDLQKGGECQILQEEALFWNIKEIYFKFSDFV